MILALMGCTFAPGAAFVTLDGGRLETGFDPGARAIGDDRVITDRGAVYRLASFTADVHSVALQELQGGGGGGGAFDPANPPEGYSLCHGGHCHAADGSLVDYSEIELALAGGSASFVTVSDWEVEATLDLLDGVALALGRPSETLLPEVTLTRVVVELEGVELAGEVEDDGLASTPFTVTLPGTTLSADLGFRVDRDAPAEVRLEVGWPVDGTLLDDLSPGPIALDPGLDEGLVDALSARLASQPLAAALREVP